jgi:hypothetical protein
VIPEYHRGSLTPAPATRTSQASSQQAAAAIVRAGRPADVLGSLLPFRGGLSHAVMGFYNVAVKSFIIDIGVSEGCLFL